MTADIHIFDGITRLDIPADRVLEAALGQLRGVVLAGYDLDGNLYTASSYADGADALWLLELCKKRLLAIEDD